MVTVIYDVMRAAYDARVFMGQHITELQCNKSHTSETESEWYSFHEQTPRALSECDRYTWTCITELLQQQTQPQLRSITFKKMIHDRRFVRCERNSSQQCNLCCKYSSEFGNIQKFIAVFIILFHHFICSMKFNSTDTCTCSREQDSKVQLEHWQPPVKTYKGTIKNNKTIHETLEESRKINFINAISKRSESWEIDSRRHWYPIPIFVSV